MIAFVLFLAASAADLDRYPVHAPVALPEEGIVRIAVPLDLRSPQDFADATDLLLVDGAGEVVPIVRVASSGGAESVSGADFVVRPTLDPGEIAVEVRNRPIDALTVRTTMVPSVAMVRVDHRRDGDWVPVSAPTLVWHIDAGEQVDVPLTEAVTGELRVRLEWRTPEPSLRPEVAGLRHPAPRVPDHVVPVPVSSWRLQENGYARYDVSLPQAWPASRIVLRPTDPLFDREAGAVVPSPGVPGESMWWEQTPGGWESVQRMSFGGASVERTSIMAPSPASDQITVLVAARDRPPLNLPEVALVVPGVHLVVQDPGPGPHTLYGGAPQYTSPTYDLASAAAELTRIRALVVEPGPATANPDYVSPEVRGGLVAPSGDLPIARYRWAHDVSGPAGIVRIPLPNDVLAHARSDLGDLRLVSADGRQIPYVLRRRGVDADLGVLQFERTERGKQSILEAKLPEAGVPLAMVAITTSAPVFQRRVTLARPAGPNLDTIRAYDWIGEDRPGTLFLSVGEQVVGDTLVVTIDNGDDPPLPIDRITASAPAWELWAALPGEGTRLVYGNPSAHRPDYDLSLLTDQIGRRVVASAQTGPRVGLIRPPPSLADRVLTAFGIGVLGIGLLVLTIRLIRAAPKAKAEARTEAQPD